MNRQNVTFNSERAKEIILEQGRTSHWVAAKIGVQTNTLYAYLNDIRKPRPPVIRLLAQALGVSESELIKAS